MPRISRNPRLFEWMDKLSISDFTNGGHLVERTVSEGLIVSKQMDWYITFLINTLGEEPYVRFVLHTVVDGHRYVNLVTLVRIPSNLGKGTVWYFVCPLTGKRCRTLYASTGYFYHRSAYADAMYYLQTESKDGRLFARIGNADRASKRFASKAYSRSHYNGKPTKRFERLLRKVERARINAVEAKAILDRQLKATEELHRSMFGRGVHVRA